MVVLATNIAETSITLRYLGTVIDLGFAKISAYDPVLGCQRPLEAPISRAAALHRSGRAGRTIPGTVYRLYTERLFRSMVLDGAIPRAVDRQG